MRDGDLGITARTTNQDLERSFRSWRRTKEEHMVDALAQQAEEGRGHATKCTGEALAAGDPVVSEWGNPPG